MTENTSRPQATRNPGWYRGGEGGPAQLGGSGHDLWQWWDGRQWKPLEPGDEAAGDKAYNRRFAGRLTWVIAGLVVVGICWQAIASGAGL